MNKCCQVGSLQECDRVTEGWWPRTKDKGWNCSLMNGCQYETLTITFFTPWLLPGLLNITGNFCFNFPHFMFGLNEVSYSGGEKTNEEQPSYSRYLHFATNYSKSLLSTISLIKNPRGTHTQGWLTPSFCIPTMGKFAGIWNPPEN